MANSGIAAKSATRVMNVLDDGPNPPSGTLTLALLPRGLDPAKFNHRLTACFGWIHSSRNSGCDCMFEMKLDLFLEFAALFAKNQEAKARQQFRDHEDASAARPRTDAIAEDKRSHVANSVASCFLPVWVRR
jgi:hypothetical protein